VTRRLVVGLTGGIGSGKSAAAAEFERLGATLVDTDAIAHELTGPQGRAIAALREAFGPDAVASNGALDRAWMRARAFSDPAAKQRLESILHPMIREDSERRIREASGAYVIYAVPLLVEGGDYRKRVDRVLVVDVPEAVQVERVRARSGLDEAAVRAIMRNQATREARLAAADDVLDNSGSLDALRHAVRALHEKYLQLAQS
jgi:dephospho-CoA kinase